MAYQSFWIGDHLKKYASEAIETAKPRRNKSAAQSVKAVIDESNENSSSDTAAGADALVTVARTMRIIELLADSEVGMSVSEIARHLDVNKNLAFRIVNSLLALRYLRQDRETLAYKLTYKISNLGLRKLATGRFLSECFPILHALAEKTGEHTRLAVIEDGIPIWVHSETGKQWGLMIDSVYSHELSYHAHATAKAWLATLPEARVREILGPSPFVAYTPYTITSLRPFLDDLKTCRAQGFAISYEERELGVATLAAPIMAKNPSGVVECVGVVSMAAPTPRMDRERFIACAPEVVSTVWPTRANA